MAEQRATKTFYHVGNGSPIECLQDPKNPNNWLNPPEAIDVAPPPFNKASHRATFDRKTKGWTLYPRREEAINKLRKMRDLLLVKSDWRMTDDYPYSDKAAWMQYRSELRELPTKVESNEFPISFDDKGSLVFNNWPTPPAGA